MLDALLSGEFESDAIVPPVAALPGAVPPAAGNQAGGAAEGTHEPKSIEQQERDNTTAVLNGVEGILGKKVKQGRISAEEQADIERRHHLFEMYAEGRITEEEFEQATAANIRYSEVAVSKPEERAKHARVNVLSLFALRRKKHAKHSEPSMVTPEHRTTAPLVAKKEKIAAAGPPLGNSGIPSSSGPQCLQRARMAWTCEVCSNANGMSSYHCEKCIISKDFYFEQTWRARPKVEDTKALYDALVSMGFPKLIFALVTYGIETPAELAELKVRYLGAPLSS